MDHDSFLLKKKKKFKTGFLSCDLFGDITKFVISGEILRFPAGQPDLVMKENSRKLCNIWTSVGSFIITSLRPTSSAWKVWTLKEAHHLFVFKLLS